MPRTRRHGDGRENARREERDRRRGEGGRRNDEDEERREEGGERKKNGRTEGHGRTGGKQCRTSPYLRLPTTEISDYPNS